MTTARSLKLSAIAAIFVGVGALLAGCSGSSAQRMTPSLVGNSQHIMLDSHGKTHRLEIDGSIDTFTADGSGGIWLISTRWLYNPVSTLVHIPAQGNVNRYPIPTSSSIFNVIVAQGGNVYWAETSAGKIGRASPAGVIRELKTPTAGSSPVDVAAGQGLVWFAEGGGSSNEGGGNEAIGAIYPDGRIVEHPIRTPADEAAGAGALGLRDDGAGGVWFVATRHDLYCSPVPCPEFLGHLKADNSLSRRSIPQGSFTSGSLFALGGYWFGDPHNDSEFSLDVVTNGGHLKQFRGQPEMVDEFPIGTMSGAVWASTQNPLSVFHATLTSRSRYIPLSPPGAGIDDWISPIVGDGYVWMTDSIGPLNSPTATYAYRFDPNSRTFETIRMEGTLPCKVGLTPRPVLSKGTLWTIDTCDPGHVWAVTF